MTINFLGPGLTVNVEAKVKEQIILDSSGIINNMSLALECQDFPLTLISNQHHKCAEVPFTKSSYYCEICKYYV